jgi:hypothetical protein
VGSWRGISQGKVEGRRMWWIHFLLMYENRAMELVEIVLEGGGG